MAPIVEKVSFKTLDGLTLVGRLYPAHRRGPGVIMTPGFTCVKEMFLPEVAEQFQHHGVTALIYDPRNLGESQGLPRNDINPVLQISDYSDALTFMKTLSYVDPDQIAFWGQSFAGCVAMCAAALDRRAKLCISICPLFNFEPPEEKLPRVLFKSMRDRESQIAGNPPLYLPVYNEKGDNPAGVGHSAGRDGYEYMTNAKFRGAPNHDNKTTLQTYYKLIMWQPQSIMKHLGSTPVLMVVPELDTVSPSGDQLAVFASLSGPKKMHMAPRKGHFDVLSGDEFADLCEMQARFVQDRVATLG